MPSSPSIDPGHGVPTATDLDSSVAFVPSRPRLGRGGCPEDFASFLRRQDEVDAMCKELGVPKELAARPADGLRANSAPPPGAICAYLRALEAGMEVPPRGFSRDVLAHFGIAPAQLTPNGWRIIRGFLGLCRSSGVPPSPAVFRHFFVLSVVSKRQKEGWYFFRSRDSSGLLFTGLPNPNGVSLRYWKHEFFFLSSPEPWPCPVEWGEPPKSSFRIPVLAGEEKKSAAKLLRAHGGAAVDLRMCLCRSDLEAAMTTTAFALPLPPPPPAPSSSSIISCPEGMDPSVYDMMKTMLAEKLKAEHGSEAAGSSPLCGKKRGLEEANDEECPSPSMLPNTALSFGVCSPPPGFPRKPRHVPSRHGGEDTDWAATREQLEEADQEKAKAKAELAATRAELAKANAGLAAAEAEVAKAKEDLSAAERAAGAEEERSRPELAMEVAKAEAKLAAAKRALEEELESAKAAALRQLLRSEDDVRRRAEDALDGYRRWRSGSPLNVLVDGTSAE